jgi:hypothetical protein
LVEEKIMEPDEIRAEIERRRKRAKDLKMRETLWALYNAHLRYYAENLKKDPKIIYPEIRETMEISNAYVQFRLGDIMYRVFYTQGPTLGEHDQKTQIAMGLSVDEERVFDFEFTKTVAYTPEMPLFSERMGEVTRFIEGPWVTTIPELLQKIKAYENSMRDERQAPEVQRRLREDMKRFGL